MNQGNWRLQPTVKGAIKEIQLSEDRRAVIEYIESLENCISKLEAFQQSVNEALNTGDGTYKP